MASIRQLLKRNQEEVVTKMKTTKLVDNLLGKNVVSREEEEEVNNAGGMTAKARKLVAILDRKSDDQLELFVQALRDTKQPHVADLLHGVVDEPAEDKVSRPVAHAQEIQISEAEYPSWYKEGQYDAAVIFYDNSEDDSDKKEAYAFKYLLERLVGNGNPPQLFMIDELSDTNSKLEKLDRVIRKSTYIFLFVTDKFINDTYCIMQKDELIMTTIVDYDKRWKVIPVMAKAPTQKLPIGIRALNKLSLSRLDYRKNLIESLNSLTHENICKYDRYFLEAMNNLFQKNKDLKKAREEQDEKELGQWKEKEKKRRKEEMSREKEEFEGNEAQRNTEQITLQTSTLQIAEPN